jgi:ubiquinone/menaquinone biosynthesis C-methylase UbiE
MGKTICTIQWHYTDEDKAHKYNVIDVAKCIPEVNDIILAVPDIPENRILERYAKQWNVRIFYGDIYNVTKRIYDAALKYKAQYIIRPSIDWFFMDVDLVSQMIDKLKQTDADFVNLPLDMDIRFGADVFSITYLKKLLKLFEEDVEIKNKYQFHPYACAELTDYFDVEVMEIQPWKDPHDFYPIYEKMKNVWSGDGTDYSDRPINSYQQAAGYIQTGDQVLDVACGTGFGTFILAKKAGSVDGIDLEYHLIKKCRQKFGSLPNVHFLSGDILKMDLPFEKYDKIVSLHTMEHIKNDGAFLNILNRSLKNDGTLILEVPIFTKSLYKGVTMPLNPFHVIEYEPEGLKKLCSEYFEIEKGFGVNRGFYTTLDKCRNAMMLILKKKGK